MQIGSANAAPLSTLNLSGSMGKKADCREYFHKDHGPIARQ
jgi:hypothetical protein